MKTALIIPSWADSPLLANTVRSARSGGYDQDILIVCPVKPSMPNVIHLPCQPKQPVDLLLHQAVTHLDDESTELVIYAHSDVTFHPGWWQGLKKTWAAVNQDMIWCLSIPVADAPLVGADKLVFGLDCYEHNYIGRISPCVSFPCRVIKNYFAKHGPDTWVGFDVYLFREMMFRRKWGCFANACRISHLCRGDSRLDQALVDDYDHRTHAEWLRRTGQPIGHFIGDWCGGVLWQHAPEILAALNRGDYAAIDYLFDLGKNL